MSQQLAKALIVPLPDKMSKQQLKNLDPDKIQDKIELDFNPESLSINVQNGQEKDRKRKGRQETQVVGNTTTTLSFQAVFDNTRSKTEQSTGDSQQLDVRIKTSKIANLMQEHKRKGKKKSSPKRVRFSWGTIIFDGLIKSYSETLDYFSADGVPLRSKVNISITEQKFLYEVDAETIETESNPTSNSPSNTGGQQSNSNVGNSLGINANLSLSANASISLSNQEALDVFGGAVIDNHFSAEVDLGLVPGISEVASVLIDKRPATSWAPDGPKGGTSESELATLINQNRARSKKTNSDSIGVTSFSADGFAKSNYETAINNSRDEGINPSLEVGKNKISIVSSAKVLPVRGSPPIAQGISGSIIDSIFRSSNSYDNVEREYQPSWESSNQVKISSQQPDSKVCCQKQSFKKW